MKHLFCLSVWIFTFIIGGGLFWTSNEVQNAESERRALSSNISGHKERFAVLSAEWHYLNNPAYLDELAGLAFNDETDSSERVTVLADSSHLPKMEGLILPARKPEIPAHVKESVKKDAPVIVAAAKNVQPLMKATARAVPRKSQSDFSMVLASWTR